MRVTIEHREEATGFFGNHKTCYIDCTVEFSQEERAIIKERDLYREGFLIRTSKPLPTGSAMLGTASMGFVAFIITFGGILGLIAETVVRAKSNYGAIAIVIGIVLHVWARLRARREDKRLEADEEQVVTIKQLFRRPTFVVHAWNAGTAKAIDHQIRDRLTVLKRHIQDCATLNPPQTFEL